MTAVWVDTHCHLDEDAFATDRAAVIERAAEQGVERIVAVGTTAASSRDCIRLAEAYPELVAAVGIQPNYVGAAQPGDWEVIVELAQSPHAAAIGETGLDRYWDSTPFEQQREMFLRHIELAQQLGKPFIVHMRECETDIVAALREAAERFGTLRGVMHSFTGSPETAAACLELGLHISFAGMLTFKKNQTLRETAAGIPRDRLLVETDAPYLAPMPFRGKRNEPAHVRHTGACLAEVHGCSPDEMAAITSANARMLFDLNVTPIT